MVLDFLPEAEYQQFKQRVARPQPQPQPMPPPEPQYDPWAEALAMFGPPPGFGPQQPAPMPYDYYEPPIAPQPIAPPPPPQPFQLPPLPVAPGAQDITPFGIDEASGAFGPYGVTPPPPDPMQLSPTLAGALQDDAAMQGILAPRPPVLTPPPPPPIAPEPPIDLGTAYDMPFESPEQETQRRIFEEKTKREMTRRTVDALEAADRAQKASAELQYGAAMRGETFVPGSTLPGAKYVFMPTMAESGIRGAWQQARDILAGRDPSAEALARYEPTRENFPLDKFAAENLSPVGAAANVVLDPGIVGIGKAALPAVGRAALSQARRVTPAIKGIAREAGPILREGLEAIPGPGLTVKPITQPPGSIQALNTLFPKAPEQLGGLSVLSDVPNMGSVESSLNDYEILPGVRTVRMSAFPGELSKKSFYAADDWDRVDSLANQIKASGQIKPLIVVVDNEGPYILEGSHRVSALYELGQKEFPAVVVVDRELLPVQAVEPAPTFYSVLDTAIDSPKLPKRASAQQITGTLKGLGVKDAELDATGVRGLLDDAAAQGRMVTRDELRDAFDLGRVEVEEVVKGEGRLTPEQRERLKELDYRDRFPEGHPQALTPEERGEAEYLRFDMAEPTKYSQYQVPGAEEGSYRELLLTLPEKPPENGWVAWQGGKKAAGPFTTREEAVQWGTQRGLNPESDFYVGPTDAKAHQATQYKSPHWSEPNTLAHIRFNDRVDADGKKVLFVEEIQSDWHQAGKRKGYINPNAQPRIDAIVKQLDDPDWRYSADPAETQRLREELSALRGGVPDAPFKKNWPELAFKRMLKYATDNGYDRVSWTTGAIQADRYDLRKTVDAIKWNVRNDGTYDLRFVKGGREVPELAQRGLDQRGLEEYIGKEPTAKIVGNEYAAGTLEGEDLAVGGQAMASFYDRELVNIANQLGKRHGARVGETQIPTGKAVRIDSSNRVLDDAGTVLGEFGNRQEANEFLQELTELRKVNQGATVHSLDLTPSLRQEATTKGFPLFVAPESVGATAGGLVGAATAPEDATPEERTERVLQGIVGGGFLGGVGKAMAKRNPQLLQDIRRVLPGNTVEATGDIEPLLTRYRDIHDRLEEIGAKMYDLGATKEYVKAETPVLRPDPKVGGTEGLWAGRFQSWNDEDIARFAAQEQRDPSQVDWWDALDTVAYKDYLGSRRPTGGKASQLKVTNGELRALQAEEKGLQAELDALEAEMRGVLDNEPVGAATVAPEVQQPPLEPTEDAKRILDDADRLVRRKGREWTKPLEPPKEEPPITTGGEPPKGPPEEPPVTGTDIPDENLPPEPTPKEQPTSPRYTPEQQAYIDGRQTMLDEGKIAGYATYTDGQRLFVEVESNGGRRYYKRLGAKGEVSDVSAKSTRWTEIERQAPAPKETATAGGQEPPKGPPTTERTPPTGEPPKEREGFAGNIRLSKYVDEARQEILQDYARANPAHVEEMRRGIRSDAQVLEDAQKLMKQMNGDPSKLVKRWQQGQAWNAEELTAIKGALNDKAGQIVGLRAEIKKGNEGGATLLRLVKAIEEHKAIQDVVHGVTAEAGRSLRILRRDAEEALTNPEADKINSLLRRYGRFLKADEAAELLSKTDVESIDDVYRFVQAASNPRLNDYLTEIFYNWILSGPRTHVVNTGSNALAALMTIPESLAAAGVESVLARVQGRQAERFFGEATPRAFGLIQGVPEGMRAALYTIRHGFTPDNATKWEFRPRAFKASTPRPISGLGGSMIGAGAGATQGDTMDERLRNAAIGAAAGFGFGAVKPGLTGRTINLPSTALEAADAFFRAVNYRAAFNAEAYRLARREGLNGQALAERIATLKLDPPADLLDRVGHEAEYRLFRQEPGEWTQKVIGLRDAPVGKVQPLRFFAPFIQTPANLLKYGMERSPLGLFNPTMYAHIAARDPKAADELSRTILGSLMGAGIAYYVWDGKITGAAPRDKAERDRFYAAGKQPFAFKVGDAWVSYRRLEPFNQTFSQVASVVESIQEGKRSPLEIAADVARTIGKNFLSQEYMSGMSDVIDAIEDPDRYGNKAFERFVTSMAVPFSSATRTAAQFADQTVREPGGDFGQKVTESIKASVPGMSEEVPAKLTAFGEEVQRESPPWSPVNVTTAKDEPVVNELNRLDMNVGFAPKKLTVDKQEIELSREQHDAFQRSAGQAIKEGLSVLVGSDYYKRADDDHKKELIRKVGGQMARVARENIIPTLPGQANEGQALRATVEQLKAYARGYAGALGQYEDFNALPKYQGISKAREEQIAEIGTWLREQAKGTGRPEASYKGEAAKRFGNELMNLYERAQSKYGANPDREKYWRAHPELRRFFPSAAPNSWNRGLEPARATPGEEPRAEVPSEEAVAALPEEATVAKAEPKRKKKTVIRDPETGSIVGLENEDDDEEQARLSEIASLREQLDKIVAKLSNKKTSKVTKRVLRDEQNRLLALITEDEENVA